MPKRKKTRVVVAGTFDGIHPGHHFFLNQARELGDELVVIVARSKTVELIKGHESLRGEQERCDALSQLPMVEEAVLGDEAGDFLRLVVQLRPDVLALGYDQWPKESSLVEELEQRGLPSVRVVRLEPYQPHRYHSSILKRNQTTD